MLPARLPAEAVADAYTRMAPFHDLFAVLFEARARRLALDWLAVRDGERVLEVAVGTGLSFSHLLRRNPSGWTEGLDRTPAMLRRARRRARRAPTSRYRLTLGDARRLPYPDASFDALLNTYMFDLLPERDFVPVLREFRRVLRPRGRLVVTCETVPERPHEHVWDTLYRLHPSLMGGCRGIRLAPSLPAAGLAPRRRRRVSQRSFPSEVVLAVPRRA